MRFKVIYTLAALMMVGCTIGEELSYTVNRRPGILARYDTKTSTNVRTYIFDDKGYFVDSVVSNMVQIKDTVRLLDGVPMVEYTLISYSNASRFTYSTLQKGVSRFEDIELMMVNPNPREFMLSCDSLLYGMTKITARRGDNEDIVATPRYLYYDVKVSIVGFTELTQPLADFAIEFRNVPLGFDGLGDGFKSTGRFRPTLFDNGDEQDGKQANLVLNRFADNHKVELHALSQGVSLGYELITPSLFGIDVDGDELQTINVSLIMNTSTINIYINDWFIGTIQLASIGG